MAIQPPRKIMIAFDGSPSAQFAFDWYRVHFIKDRDDVHLFNCIEQSCGFACFRGGKKTQKEIDEEAEMVKDKMEQLSNEARFKCAVIQVRNGKASEAIIKAVADYKVDTVILGTHGMTHSTNTKNGTAGSNAHYIMHHAKIPTITVRYIDTPLLTRQQSIEVNAPKSRRSLNKEKASVYN